MTAPIADAVITATRDWSTIPLDGGSQSIVVRVGSPARRVGHSWSSAVRDLPQDVEREGFGGAPRALGFDEQGEASDLLKIVWVEAHAVVLVES